MLSKPSSAKMLADFRPFQAWRYNLDQINIGDVIAPPYDVISPAEQTALYERSTNNCIRLILNKEESSDNDQNNRYTRARDFFKEWQQKKVLIQETKPCFYYYRQTFKHPLTGEIKERSALLGRFKLEPFEKQIIIPHEKTLSKPRADRRRLLEATKTNFSPIFGLYEYDHGQNEAIQRMKQSAPLFETTDGQGVQHAIWIISDQKIIEGIHQGISTQRIYIADGHHRYQTSLEYAEVQRALKKAKPEEELDSDFTLMALVHFYDPGMLILPTHRMILPFKGYSPAKQIEALKTAFQVDPMPMDQIQKVLSQSTKQIQTGLQFEDGSTYLLTFQDPAEARKRMPEGKADLWYDLDVALVSHLILGSLWGVPESEWESTIRYTHSTEEALDQVKTKKVAASFFLRAPKVELLRDMGAHKELMPQKSTYFYPKLASGLVFNQHEK